MQSMISTIKFHIDRLVRRIPGTLNFGRSMEWRLMLRHIQNKNNEKILDIACGSGELCLKLKKKGLDVYGIDLSPYFVRRAHTLQKQGEDINFLASDAEYIPFKADSFDQIICSSSLEHFQQNTQALNEMYRVLKPHGQVTLSTDSLSYPIDKNLKNYHKNRYYVTSYFTLEELSALLQKSGFSIVSGEYLLNSSLPCFFYRLLIRTEDKQFIHTLIFLITNLLIPFFILTDNIFGKKDCGYSVVIIGEK